MNLKQIINNKEKYEKEFNVWKNVNSILNKKTIFETNLFLFSFFILSLYFALSFCLFSFFGEFDLELFFLSGIVGGFFILIISTFLDVFFREIKYKNNIKKNNPYLKLFSSYQIRLRPSMEKKIIKNIKQETDTVGFDNYLNFVNIIENYDYEYETNSNFTSFIILIIEKSQNEELITISEEELINFLKNFSLEEQELITKKIKDKISRKKSITDNIKNNLTDIKNVSVNNKIIKEL